MKNNQKNNDQRSPQNNNNRKGVIEPRPAEKSQRNKDERHDNEDAGGTGLGHKKEQGERDREIRKQ